MKTPLFRRSALRFPFTAFLIGNLVLAGCASRYSLKPTSEKPEKLNGIELETFVNPGCVLQAGFQDSNADEMLLRVRITNKGEAFSIDPTAFVLTGAPEALKEASLRSVDPDQYVKELNASADTFEARTKMESHQGIEELADLKIGESSKAIDEAKNEYESKKKDAERSKKKAADLRARVAVIQPAALRKTTLKKGETTEGLLVFKNAFKDEGPVALTSENAGCPGALNFVLKD